MRIPLVREFRFVHEPSGMRASDTAASPARGEALAQLTSRIMLSHGGAFLLAGYRGVGKTTLVNTLIARVQARVQDHGRSDERGGVRTGAGTDVRLLHIPLTLARPVPPDKLMYRLISALHEELERQRLLEVLPPRLAADIALAVRRTSMSITVKDMASTDRSGTFSFDLPKWMGIGTGVKLGGKRSRSRGEDMRYLVYDDVAAEQDLIRIARALTREGGVPQRRKQAWKFWRRSRRLQLKLLFVFDEMDKLDEIRESGEAAEDPVPGAAVDEILQTLKTLLTTSGITFLFVTGRDLYDRYRRDVSLGDSIYESVFTFVQYVPALWDGVRGLCDPLVDETVRSRSDTLLFAAYDAFRSYLTFHGRGIPRRILRSLHRFVTVEDATRAFLEISPEDVRRFRFFADVETALGDAEAALIEPGLIEQEAHRIDQERLALRYLTDWILSQRTGYFTIEDAIAAARDLSARTAPTETAAPRVVRGLIDALVRHALLERIEEAGRSVKVAVVEGTVTSETYRIPWPRLIELGHRSPSEEDVGSQDWRERTGLPERYIVLKQLAAGAFSEVYEARDLLLARRVAIKLFPADLPPEGRLQLQREIDALRGRGHPNIVEFVDADLGAARPFIVMALIDGLSLRDLAQGLGALGWAEAVTITGAILAGLEHLHAQDILWLDAKPANVIVSETGRVTMIDFGAALEIGAASRTATQTTIGTPRFMAPERIQGAPPSAQADLFSVGAIIFELVTGRPAFPGPSPTQALQAVLSGRMAEWEGADVPPALKAVIERALAANPEDRFASAAAMRAALPDGAPPDALGLLVRAGLAAEQAAAERESERTQIIDFTPDADVLPAGTTMAEAPAPPPPQAPVPQPTVPPSPGAAAPDDDPLSDNDAQDLDLEMAPAPPIVDDPFALSDDAWPDPDGGDPGSAWILRLEDGARLEDIAVPDLGIRPLTIGRSASNDIIISDAEASRYHAQIKAGPEGIPQIDVLNTPNGVLLNGRRVYGDHLLTDGAEMEIGAARLTLKARRART